MDPVKFPDREGIILLLLIFLLFITTDENPKTHRPFVIAIGLAYVAVLVLQYAGIVPDWK